MSKPYFPTDEENMLHLVKLLRDGHTVNLRTVRAVFGRKLTADEARQQVWAAQEVAEMSGMI
jgi:hypothetical protein